LTVKAFVTKTGIRVRRKTLSQQSAFRERGGIMAQYLAENHTEMNVSLPLAARYRTLLEVNKAAITQPTPDKVFESMCAALKQLILFDRAGLTL
jgi:hypothetical protein